MQMKSIAIKGKNYITVAERLRYLAEEIKDYSLTSEYTYHPEQRLWIVKATLKIGECLFEGLAQEIESDDYKNVNSTSALENAQTSAWGRACAAAGIGIVDGVASADEVNKAENRKTTRNPHWKYSGKTENGEDLISGSYQGREWWARLTETGERAYYKTKDEWLSAHVLPVKKLDPLPEFNG